MKIFGIEVEALSSHYTWLNPWQIDDDDDDDDDRNLLKILKGDNHHTEISAVWNCQQNKLGGQIDLQHKTVIWSICKILEEMDNIYMNL